MSTSPLLSLLLVLTFILGSAYAVPVEPGSYIVYDYSLSIGERQLAGYIREEVLRDYGNGSIRLRFEATMNDGVLTIEKNVPEEAFQIPLLPRVSEGIITYSDANRTITLSVEGAGSAEVGIGGRRYSVDSYRISLEIETRRGAGERPEGLLSLSGVLQVIRGSGVIYSFEGVARGDGPGELRFITRLLDTNINLDEVQTSSGSSMGAAEMTVPVEFVQRFVTLRDPGRQQALAQATENTRTDDSSLRAVVIVAAGLAALAIAAIVPSRIGSTGSKPREDKRPHYV